MPNPDMDTLREGIDSIEGGVQQLLDCLDERQEPLAEEEREIFAQLLGEISQLRSMASSPSNEPTIPQHPGDSLS